jgi:phosphatidylglycerol lysyltransferase
MVGALVLALWSVYKRLHGHYWLELIAAFGQIPTGQVGWALMLTLISYLAMSCYDFLALKYIRRSLEFSKTALAAFLGYAFSNNVGMSMVAGATIRYRIYSARGLSVLEITQVVIFCSISLWLGFLALGGAVFLIEPLALPLSFHLPFTSARWLGIVLLMVPLGYMLLSLFFRKEIQIKQWRFSIPAPHLAAGQLLIAMGDWFLGGMVLYTLLPHHEAIGVGHFLGIYLLAQLGGLISQLPGGLGIFESIMLLLAPSTIPVPQLLGALIVYRGIYYLLPLAVALSLLGLEEMTRSKTLVKGVSRLTGQLWSNVFIPLLSMGVFFAGATLLVSGALPGTTGRILFLEKIIPLPVIEISHFLGSLTGLGLLVLARGLQLRLDAAYLMTLGLLATGAAISLLKGLDYEEAVILWLVFMILLPGREHFFRKASLFSERFTAGWIAAIATVLLVSGWLGLFAFHHIDYSHDLWWHFSIRSDAPRFMRASVGAFSLAMVLALGYLLKPAPPPKYSSDEREMEDVKAIVQQSPNTDAYLALLGDKQFLLSEAGNTFIMYGVSGRSWVSMGDPIGPEAQWPELIWQFRRNAMIYADRAVFYEVGHNHLHLYLDLGLSALKLGEEARVALPGFTLEGSDRKEFRHVQRKFTKQGYTFEIAPASGVAGLIPALKVISDQWLKNKNTREKRFSLGFFKPDYLCQTPVALVRLEGRVVAFANVWPGGGRQELAIDLMRYLPDAPNGTMDYLFIEMMQWGRAQGYQWFNLGMAPLSGLENRDQAPLWHKFGHWLARHGEHFYNFQGLRRYKEKFTPIWSPKYLICPGGLALPRILTDVAGLISGGLKGILLK